VEKLVVETLKLAIIMAVVAALSEYIGLLHPLFGPFPVIFKLLFLLSAGAYASKKLEAQPIIAGTIGVALGAVGGIVASAVHWTLFIMMNSGTPSLAGIIVNAMLEAVIFAPLWAVAGFVLGAIGAFIAASKKRTE
jgi:hypothetical protein